MHLPCPGQCRWFAATVGADFEKQLMPEDESDLLDGWSAWDVTLYRLWLLTAILKDHHRNGSPSRDQRQNFYIGVTRPTNCRTSCIFGLCPWPSCRTEHRPAGGNHEIGRDWIDASLPGWGKQRAMMGHEDTLQKWFRSLQTIQTVTMQNDSEHKCQNLSNT